MPIRITAKQDGFRRCGIAHPATPTEYPGDQFSKKELEQLKAEPMLVVEEIPEAENPGKDPDKEKTKK